LVTSVVPAAMLLGVGWGAMTGWSVLNARARQTIRLGWGVVLIAALSGLSLSLLWSQTLPGSDPETGERAPLPPWSLSDAFASRSHPLHPDAHPINTLPPHSTVMLVADTSRLFYLRPELVYASAFDASPLGPVLDQAEGDPSRAARLLAEQGVTHLWVGWSELRRLHDTYGHDERVTESAVAELVRGWPVVQDLGGAALFRVPGP
ncbi:MAG: hypothetical protein AAGE65_13620, partial [Planctomycetota bacterium]